MNSRVVKTVKAATVLALIMGYTSVMAQARPQVINVPLSNPGEPMTLDIDILSARIEVIGEDREDTEFSITVSQGSRKIITPSGSKPITAGAYELEVDENDNHISVDTDWRADKVIVVARIPRRADLELSTTNDGEIIVSNIIGKLQLENTNGPITARNISGSVIAESVNRDIDIGFSSVDSNEPMVLTTINGTLTVGLPDDAGVQLHIDSAQGEIYSDFEVEMQPSTPVVERRTDRGGMAVRVESVIVANINGGGPVIKLKTLNGDIQIRKNSN